MTSYDARKDPPRREDLHSLSGLAAYAIERLESAQLARSHRQVKPGDDWIAAAQLDVLLSIAATLIRTSAAPRPRARSGKDASLDAYVAAHSAQLAEAHDEQSALRATVERLVARLDAVEDRP